jgi:hypothetical protein
MPIAPINLLGIVMACGGSMLYGRLKVLEAEATKSASASKKAS